MSGRDEVREALKLGMEYAWGALTAHDAAYKRHSATEAERADIVEDIVKIAAALSASGQEERLERLEEFAESVASWAEAYPEKIFHEPTSEQFQEVCKALGCTPDCFAASVLRVFTKPWGERAREALAAPALEKGNPQMADELSKSIDRINGMGAERVGEVLGEAAMPSSLLPLLRDVEEALADLGACDNPYCTDCPRVLPRVREAIREHAAGTEPEGRIR